MKKIILTSIMAISIMAISFAQPHPGQNSDGSGTTGGPLTGPTGSGGGAPLGSGLTIMLVLGVGYGLSKWHQSKLEE